MYGKLNQCELTPRRDIEDRIRRLQIEMVRQGISFSIILHNVGLFYLTGSIQRGVLFLPAEGSPIYMVEKNVERASIETPLNIIPLQKKQDLRDILRNRINQRSIGGMELDVLPVLVFEKWKNLLELENIVDISPSIKKLRSLKSPFEIDQIRRSGQIVSRVFAKAGEIIQANDTEVGVAAALEAEGRMFGHQGFLRMRGFNQEMMNIYVTHGYSGTIFSGCDVPISGFGTTHAVAQGPSIQNLQQDTPILVDYGGAYNGYVTDETRVFVVGSLKDLFRKAFEAARDMIDDVAAFGRVGVDTVEIYERALELARQAHLEEHFMGY